MTVITKQVTLLNPYLEEAPFEELCGADVLVSAVSSIGLIGSICTELLELAPILSPLLPTSFPHFHAFHDP